MAYPFVYPSTPHLRLHGPAGWKDYQRYRQWLRDEFAFRCVYCLNREQFAFRDGGFQIDHWKPQVSNPKLKADYDNLIYACARCNNLKRAEALPDPCVVAYGSCLRVAKDGSITALSREGRRLVRILKLDSQDLRQKRFRMIRTLSLLRTKHKGLFIEWAGYPKDLPDLTDHKQVPLGNSKPEGVNQSHHARLQRKELPEWY